MARTLLVNRAREISWECNYPSVKIPRCLSPKFRWGKDQWCGPCLRFVKVLAALEQVAQDCAAVADAKGAKAIRKKFRLSP